MMVGVTSKIFAEYQTNLKVQLILHVCKQEETVGEETMVNV